MTLTDEDIKRLLAEAKSDNRVYEGYSPATVEKDGKVLTGFEPNIKGKRGWAKPGPVTAEVDWGLDPLKKRSERERVESLSKRLWEAAVQDPAQMETLLKRVQAEFWKSGRTVSYSDIKQVAKELMARAAADEAEKTRRTF